MAKEIYMLAKEQYIGAVVLLVIAVAAWVFVVCYKPASDPSEEERELSWAQQDSIRRVQRADSIARAKAHRDSLREARWEHYKDSCKRADDARFAAWNAERKARYDSFFLADSLWRDSMGVVFPRHIKKDTVLDLNRCDTAELQLIRGIGRYTARRIVEYREQLGGYYSPTQLTDEPFSRLRLDTLLRHFTAKPEDIQTMDVNSTAADELSRHPYLRFSQAKAIYQLRRKYVRLDGMDDLQRLEELDSVDLRRLQYYLRFD